MSLQDDVNAVKRCLDDLVRTVGQLERGLAREQARQEPRKPAAAPARPEALTAVPDAPYDASLWRGADDEGIGHHGRRAP